MVKREENFYTELKNYFKSKNLTQNDIAERLGVSVVAVNMLLNGRRNFGSVTARKWADTFGFSAMWLMTGEGKMMQEDNVAPVTPNVYLAPLVTKYAYAGYLAGYGDSDYMETLPKYPFIVDHDPHGSYYAFEVRGDSMDDGTDRSIKDGSVVLCRVVDKGLWQDTMLHIHKWVFVCVTDDGILIKRIKEHDVERGILVLESLNPAYNDINISVNEVRSIMNVVQVSYRPIF